MKLTIYADGGARGNPGPAATGIVIKNTTGEVLAAYGEYLGRPVDVQVLNDGSLLVSDDFAGAIWRISYSK